MSSNSHLSLSQESVLILFGILSSIFMMRIGLMQIPFNPHPLNSKITFISNCAILHWNGQQIFQIITDIGLTNSKPSFAGKNLLLDHVVHFTISVLTFQHQLYLPEYLKHHLLPYSFLKICWKGMSQNNRLSQKGWWNWIHCIIPLDLENK